MDSAEPIKKATVELQGIGQMVGRHGHQTLAHWYLTARGSTPPWDAAHLQPTGPGVPRLALQFACSTRFPTNAETHILHRGSGQSSGHYTPPVRGRGRGAGRVTRGGRGGRTAGGGSQAICSAAGHPANDSHTTCPVLICCCCSQSAHIQRLFCLN